MSYQPKLYKKFLATAVTSAIVGTAAMAPTINVKADSQFKDISTNQWYFEAVNDLSNKKIIEGMPDGTFNPSANVTRAQAAKMISLALGLDIENSAEINFKDVKKGTWYYKYISALVEQNIVGGYSDGTFKPNAPITRAEMAKILAFAYNISPAQTNVSFTDLNKASWASGYIAALAKQGIVGGVTNTTFAPLQTVNRAQAAAFIYKSMNKVPSPTVKPDDEIEQEEQANPIVNIHISDDIRISKGTPLTLPNKVKVEYKDGTSKYLAVDWDQSDVDIQEPGEYKVSGKVSDETVTVDVKVVSRSSTDNSSNSGSSNGSYTSPYNPYNPPRTSTNYTGDATVQSVTPLNGKQIEVVFNTAVEKDTVIASGTTKLNTTNISLTAIGDALNVTFNEIEANLSDDERTLRLSAPHSQYFNGDYQIIVNDSVKSTRNQNFETFSKVVTFNDSTRPVMKSVTYETTRLAKLYFSEPLKTVGTVQFEKSDGTPFTGGEPVASLTENGHINIDLSNLASQDKNKDIIVTIIGASDFANNLVSPNPLTTKVKYSTQDQTAPTIREVKPLTNKSFEITFSEDVHFSNDSLSFTENPSNFVTVDGANVISYEKDTSYPNKYTITLDQGLSGLQNVRIASFYDKAFNPGENKLQIVNFTVDTSEPYITSKRIEQISDETYLVLTFNEHVVPQMNKSISGFYIENYITYDLQSIITSLNNFSLYDTHYDSSKKVKLNISNLEQGNYTLTLPEGFVEDINDNDSKQAEITFYKNVAVDQSEPTVDDTVDVGETNVNGITVIAPNKLLVTFDKKLDGRTATNKNNYRVEGLSVEGVVLTENSTNKATVEVTLVDGTNKISGARNITISGIRSASNISMETYTTSEYLYENVRPTITSAEITQNNEITITFSELITPSTVDETVDRTSSPVQDFTLFFDGKEYNKMVSERVLSGNKQIVLTLSANDTFTADDLNNGVIIKPASTIDVEDVNGNKLQLTEVTTKN